jgi:imidazolonepropionase-like amidohydrolase
MKRAVSFAIACTLFCLATQAGAQTAFTGAKVHTAAGEPIEDGVVVVADDGTIEAVGGPSTPVPADATEIDASGKVITPGLVDAHTRLGVVEIWATGSTRDHDAGGDEPVRAAFRVSDGFNPQSTAIGVTREAGVTSALIVPGGGLVSGQAGWASLAAEPSIDLQAAAMVINHGERGAHAVGGSRGSLSKALRELYDDVRFYLDNEEAYDQNRSRTLAASRLDLQSLEPTLAGELPVMFRVDRASDIRAALRVADEIGLDAIIVGGAEAWQLADELAERDIAVVVDPLQNLPSRFESLGARADNAAILEAAGVPVILSSFGVHNVRKLRQGAGNAVRAGLGHAAALEAVTARPAAALGRDDIGTLEPAKRADLVVWSGDPFELSTRVDQLFVAGEEVDIDNRQRQLLERYRQLPRREAPATRD